MLWPEGAPHRFADPETYVGENGDVKTSKGFVAFCVSKPSFYIAACSTKVLLLYRLKPLAPVAVYSHPPGNLQDPESQESRERLGDYTGLATSANGTHLLAWTSEGYVLVFEVLPSEELEEVGKTSQVVTPGPGESIGLREMHLRRIATLKSKDPIVGVCGLDNWFVVVSANTLQLGRYDRASFYNVDLESLENFPKDTVVKASCSPLLSRLSLVTSQGAVVVVHIDSKQSESKEGESLPPLSAIVVTEKDAIDSAFNLRMGKLSVATKDGILRLYSLAATDTDVVDVKIKPPGKLACLQWSTLGTTLLVGTDEGWHLYSLLGMPIYKSSHVGPAGGPVIHTEWSLGSDGLFLLGKNGQIHSFNTVKWSGIGSNLCKPVIFGNGRLQLFHDGQKTRLSSHPWLTVPLPTFYVARNWPLISVCCSPDARHVAIAGSSGLMYFSVVARQWKELSDRDMQVRGGIVWYGRLLVVAVNSEYGPQLRMYSAVTHASRRHSTVPAATAGPGQGGEEEQVIAQESLSAPVVAMSLSGDLLAVLTHSASLLVYSLANHELELVKEWPLGGVTSAPARVRSLDLVDEGRRLLLLIDDKLVSLTETEDDGSKKYKRQTIAYPIEYYHVEGDRLWVFDGHEMGIHSLTQGESAESVYFGVDAYPVAMNSVKGVVATIETTALKSTAGMFWHIKPTASLEVYLPYLMAHDLSTAYDYVGLDYFEQVLETTLYHALMDDRQLKEICDLGRKISPKWPEVVAGCARKVEAKYWSKLFQAVGQRPQELFDKCLARGDLKTASEYLMVVHASETESDATAAAGDNTRNLFIAAHTAGQTEICKEVCRFLLAVDDTGTALRNFRDALPRESLSPASLTA